MAEFASGDIFAEHRIEGVIGRGGMGVVYRAVDLRLERTVAIKVIASDYASDESFRRRFERESRMAASLDHPNVLPIHAAGETGGILYITMRYVDGTDLRALIGVEGRIEPTTAAGYLGDVAAALDHAHANGLVHRDIKPANVLVELDEHVRRVYLTDFGLTKHIGSQSGLTQTGVIVGTIDYIAPEQLHGKGAIDARTDVYSLGAMAFHTITGRIPYPRDNDLAKLYAHGQEPPPSVREVDPALPPEIDMVVRRAMSKDPADRYPSAGDFGRALSAAVTGRAAEVAERSVAVGAAAPGAAPASAPFAPTMVAPVRRRRRGALLAGVLALAAVAGAAVLLLSGGDGEDEPGMTPEATAEEVPAGVPPPPAGWVDSLALGFVTSPADVDVVAERTGPGGLGTMGFSGDPAAGPLFGDGARSPAGLVSRASAAGLLPYAGIYAIRSLGRTGGPDAGGAALMQTLASADLMTTYWESVRSLMQSAGEAGAPVAISFEPGFSAAIIEELDMPRGGAGVRTVIGSTGIPELAGLPDELTSFVSAWIALRDAHAPDAMLGMAVDDYGTGIDISAGAGPASVIDRHAGLTVEAYKALGADALDFIPIEVAFSEEGFEQDPVTVYTDAEKFLLMRYAGNLAGGLGRPVVLEGVPTGNAVYRTVDDSDYHWTSSWVEWLMGDDEMANLTAMRDAGVIGINFGFGFDPADETCPCDAAGDGVTNPPGPGAVATSPDDDGGYLAERLALLRERGGLPLAR